MTDHVRLVKTLAAEIGPERPLNRYSTYLTNRYGERTYRVSVDAGFTCPVRESGFPCAYCDIRGSRAPYLGEVTELREQIHSGLAFLRKRYDASRFLLYFQAFSNTHAPVETLRQIYDAGLSFGEFEGLIVSTRPDCLDRERAALLASYRERGLDVWVELGLQTANDATLRRIRRGHSVAEFSRAAKLLADYGILCAAHVILGLPGEDGADAAATARYLSELGVDGVKFHNLVVTEGTRMYADCLAGRFDPPDAERYREMLITALENLSPGIIVMRLTCDPPRGVRSLPERLPDKATFYRDLTGEMKRRRTWQGQMLDTNGTGKVP